jgi:hypothetical protein
MNHFNTISDPQHDSAKYIADKLNPEHAQMLADSAIAPDVIAARCYSSANKAAQLSRLGFSDFQRNVPTLVVPIWNVAGEIGLYHHRPDQPRFDGKRKRIVKYEFPKGTHMAVDVHPFIRDAVRDPNVPLFVTEGVKKADAAISKGLCCIALIGTWNWRGTNEFGGKTALPDWESIALKDRRVYIVFDSDVMVKPSVHGALSRLKAFLDSRGAR